ncbi:hypothetical protein [Rhodococcus sp. NPDC058639]|uniref:hypothetical protein n=1 Tax=Rhodococcus sp. NPDC058639 TaxID=3346570 RepID=UPI0036614693
MLHDLSMIAIRVGWILIAAIAVLLGIGAATSPMLQITDCELDTYSREVPNREACNASIQSYFGNVIVPVLALPVFVSLIPVFMPRQRVAWLTTAALSCFQPWGFSRSSSHGSRPCLICSVSFGLPGSWRCS